MGRDRRQKITLALAAFAMVLTAAVPAEATSVNTAAFTYISTTDCAWVSSTIADWARPALSSVATQDWYGNGQQCGDKTNVAQTYAIALAQDLMYYSFTEQGWRYCNYGPWVQNQSPSHTVNTGFAWGFAPCGGSYYKSVGHAMSWNGGWHNWYPIVAASYVWVYSA